MWREDASKALQHFSLSISQGCRFIKSISVEDVAALGFMAREGVQEQIFSNDFSLKSSTEWWWNVLWLIKKKKLKKLKKQQNIIHNICGQMLRSAILYFKLIKICTFFSSIFCSSDGEAKSTIWIVFFFFFFHVLQPPPDPPDSLKSVEFLTVPW